MCEHMAYCTPLQRFWYSTSEQILNDTELECAPMPYPVLCHVSLKSFVDHLLFSVTSTEESNRLRAQFDSRMNLFQFAFMIAEVFVHCAIIRPDANGGTRPQVSARQDAGTKHPRSSWGVSETRGTKPL